MYNYTYTQVTVKVVCTILYSPETSLQWAATYLTLNHGFSDHSVESTEGDCIGKALSALLKDWRIRDTGIEPRPPAPG